MKHQSNILALKYRPNDFSDLIGQDYLVDTIKKSIQLNKSRTVAIGDSIFHDIKGANNFGIDSILVKSGIHKDSDNINQLCKNHQIVPTYLIEDFRL